MKADRLLSLAAHLDTCEVPSPAYFTAGALDVLPDVFPENWQRDERGYPMYTEKGIQYAPLDGAKLFFGLLWAQVGHLFIWGAQKPDRFGGWALEEDAEPQAVAGLIRAFVRGRALASENRSQSEHEEKAADGEEHKQGQDPAEL